jgi:23S rRNA pseudouridine2605 synthase
MRDRPHPQHKLEWPGGVVPEWAKPPQNNKRRGKNRGERQGGSSPGKRERLQKVMAQSGHGSRRNIEILIAQGHLTINGQLAKLGDSVGPGDKVKLDGRLLNLRFGDPLPRVLLYHKPAGEIVSRDDPEKRPTVFEKLPKVNGGRWVSVGRLDFNTEGLLIFTTSGELANRLTHPRFEVEREYAVRVMGELTEEQQKKLLEGVDIDSELCKFDAISDRGGEGSNHWYHVVLREGKNREVRKMMETVGLMVSRLMRVRFGSVELPSHVKRGMIREMEEEQVQELLAFAGMNEPPPSENGEDEGVEDELDNVGNRAPDPSRDARRHEIHVDDDIGNRFVAQDESSDRVEDEDIGNRGTYGDDAPAPQHRPQRPHGKRPFFKKHAPGHEANGNVARAPSPGGHGQGQERGQGQGQAHAQGHGPGPGQGQGQGKKHRHRNRNKHKMHGQPGQGQQNNQGQGQQPQGQHAQGQPHHAQPQGQPGQPGQGKRHRRNKHRNRNRGGNTGSVPTPDKGNQGQAA